MQDMLEKPGELLLYRPTSAGGLGLQNVHFKMLACRIRTFLETSVNPNYNHHLYHVLLYRHFIDEEELIPAPTIPPFYPLDFFNLIKDMRNSDLSLTSANTSQIYKYLLNRELLMVHDNAENKEVYKPTRVEEHHPNIDWDMVWSRSRSLSYGSAVESFIFKMVNNILPTDDRLARILPNNTKYCKICSGNITGDLQHWPFHCSSTIFISFHFNIRLFEFLSDHVYIVNIHVGN